MRVRVPSPARADAVRYFCLMTASGATLRPPGFQRIASWFPLLFAVGLTGLGWALDKLWDGYGVTSAGGADPALVAPLTYLAILCALLVALAVVLHIVRGHHSPVRSTPMIGRVLGAGCLLGLAALVGLSVFVSRPDQYPLTLLWLSLALAWIFVPLFGFVRGPHLDVALSYAGALAAVIAISLVPIALMFPPIWLVPFGIGVGAVALLRYRALGSATGPPTVSHS